MKLQKVMIKYISYCVTHYLIRHSRESGNPFLPF